MIDRLCRDIPNAERRPHADLLGVPFQAIGSDRTADKSAPFTLVFTRRRNGGAVPLPAPRIAGNHPGLPVTHPPPEGGLGVGLPVSFGLPAYSYVADRLKTCAGELPQFRALERRAAEQPSRGSGATRHPLIPPVPGLRRPGPRRLAGRGGPCGHPKSASPGQDRWHPSTGPPPA
jgi:hypothetical protein